MLARAAISPSEDPRKVLAALLNILPDGDGRIRGRVAEARSDDVGALDAIRESLASRQSLGVLRRRMRDNAYEEGTRLLLNRQAAYAGIAAVCDAPEESPLGPIEVWVESRRIGEIIERVAGRPNR